MALSEEEDKIVGRARKILTQRREDEVLARARDKKKQEELRQQAALERLSSPMQGHVSYITNCPATEETGGVVFSSDPMESFNSNVTCSETVWQLDEFLAILPEHLPVKVFIRIL